MIGYRVVVTGLATVNPLGLDLESSWQNLLAGKSGISPITAYDLEQYPTPTTIAGEVKNFEPEKYIPMKQARRMERFTQFAVACNQMLLQHANWESFDGEEENVGCILGCGLGGLETIEDNHAKLVNDGPRRVSPFMIPIIISNMATGQVSIFSKVRGPNYVTTSACASALHGIGAAFSEIKLGRAQAMITGGVESTMTPLAISGFSTMKALSRRNEEPERASRPFDKDRDGFVMGEGCGMLMLESLEHAQSRGANILAEVAGYGASADAYHMTAPPEDGRGMALAMKAALREAEMAPEELDHINAHGTSTPLNDLCETRAIKSVFGGHASKLPISANKSMIGHLLGAAGGVESVFSVMSLIHGKLPGTINYENPDPECDLNYLGDGTRDQDISSVLCNSFGFGGANACILFKKFEK